MPRPRHTLVAALLVMLPLGTAGAQSFDSLLARMTLEEKLGQLNLLSAGGKASPEQTTLVRRGLVGGLFNVIGTENTQAVDRVATTESRLKIPLLFGLDVIHGFRTIFPIPLAEAGRDYNTADVSERTLREVYLPPFKAAVDAGVATLMSAFNDIGGVPASGNAWLTDTVLRHEWGFRGMVVSDWTSVAELIPHGVAGSRAEAGQRALSAGVDMDMQSSIYVETLAP